MLLRTDIVQPLRTVFFNPWGAKPPSPPSGEVEWWEEEEEEELEGRGMGQAKPGVCSREGGVREQVYSECKFPQREG